jgi:membrane-bound lytic murein transglycosylase MltF
MFYNWQNLFDIFTSNPENRNLRYSITSPSLENISKSVQETPITFYKGSSDAVLADYGDVIKEECKYYNLDWRLVLSIIKQESAFMPEAVSHAGAFGFMQIMPRTGSSLEQTLNLEEHHSPVNNLKAGIYYYALLVGRYNDAGDSNKYRFALAAYNAGSGHVEDAMSISYYFGKNYLDWNIVKEDMKLLAPGNDSLHKEIWKSRPPNGVFANWKEPYHYVENIMYYWSQYKKIYPLPEDTPKSTKKKKKKKK